MATMTDTATHRFLAPQLDGELIAASAPVEELLVQLACWAEHEPDSPVPAALTRPAAQAVGELRLALLRAEYRGLYGPDGAYEHEPLAIVEIPEHVISTYAAAVEALEAAHSTGDHVGDAMDDFAADWRWPGGERASAAQLVDVARRVQRLCELAWGGDEQLIAARLQRADDDTAGDERVVLTDDDEAAYRRIRDRLVAAWHESAPLARWQY